MYQPQDYFTTVHVGDTVQEGYPINALEIRMPPGSGVISPALIKRHSVFRPSLSDIRRPSLVDSKLSLSGNILDQKPSIPAQALMRRVSFVNALPWVDAHRKSVIARSNSMLERRTSSLDRRPSQLERRPSIPAERRPSTLDRRPSSLDRRLSHVSERRVSTSDRRSSQMSHRPSVSSRRTSGRLSLTKEEHRALVKRHVIATGMFRRRRVFLFLLFVLLALILALSIYFALRASQSSPDPIGGTPNRTTTTTGVVEVTYVLQEPFSTELSNPNSTERNQLDASVCREWLSGYLAAGQNVQRCRITGVSVGSVICIVFLRVSHTAEVGLPRISTPEDIFYQNIQLFRALSSITNSQILSEQTLTKTEDSDPCMSGSVCPHFQVCRPASRADISTPYECTCYDGYQFVDQIGCAAICEDTKCALCNTPRTCVLCETGYQMTADRRCIPTSPVTSATTASARVTTVTPASTQVTSSRTAAAADTTVATSTTTTTRATTTTTFTKVTTATTGTTATTETPIVNKNRTTITTGVAEIRYSLSDMFVPELENTGGPEWSTMNTTVCQQWYSAYAMMNQAVEKCEVTTVTNNTAGNTTITVYLHVVVSEEGDSVKQIVHPDEVFVSQNHIFPTHSALTASRILSQQSVTSLGSCDICKGGSVCPHFQTCGPAGDDVADGYECGCYGGYSVVPGIGCRAVCRDSHCGTCVSPDLCLSCKTGYSIGPTGECIPKCTLPNCKSCSSENVCDICEDHYNLENGACIANCTTEHCASCGSPDHCFSCESGYTLATGAVCKLICQVGHCEVCNTSHTCQTCRSGYNLLADNRCEAICDPRCSWCASPGVCLACESGYHVVNGNICEEICAVSNCLNCSLSTCYECEDNYAFINESQCDPICQPDHCAECSDPDTCTKCETGHSLAGDGLCTGVCGVDYCANCSAPGNCTLCDAGYSLNDNECKAVCETPNCDQCITSTHCAHCAAGYSPVNGGRCEAICSDAFCINCTSPGNCMECKNSYALHQNVCKPVCQDDNCATCYDPLYCAECASGYFLVAGGTCNVSCGIKYCATCDVPGNCTSCIGNYSLNTNKCEPICQTSNCDICAEADPDVCISCATGYNLANGGVCEPMCDIDHCTACSIPGNCTACKENYTLAGSQCEPVCQVPSCDICADPIVCTRCASTHKLANGGVCEPLCDITNCINCSSSNQCATCEPNYMLDNNTCKPNCLDTHCEQCTVPHACTHCMENYTLAEGGICKALCGVDNCVNCTEPGVCLGCEENYQLENDICMAFCNDSGCETCFAPGACLECKYSYKISAPGVCSSVCPFSHTQDPYASAMDIPLTEDQRLSPPFIVTMTQGGLRFQNRTLTQFLLERFGIVLSGDMTVSLFFFLSHTVGNLTYRESTHPSDLALANGYVCYYLAYYGQSCDSCSFNATWAFIINYDQIPSAIFSIQVFSATVIFTSSDTQSYLIIDRHSFPTEILSTFAINWAAQDPPATFEPNFDHNLLQRLPDLANVDIPGLWINPIPVTP